MCGNPHVRKVNVMRNHLYCAHVVGILLVYNPEGRGLGRFEVKRNEFCVKSSICPYYSPSWGAQQNETKQRPKRAMAR